MSHPKNNSADTSAVFSVTVTERGPLLVHGRPPLTLQIIATDERNESRSFRTGQRFSTDAEPTALCRCGASKRKPYCDGSHTRAEWDPTLTASEEPLLEGAERIEGETLVLTDNPAYCVFARFCHPDGDTWTLTEHSEDPAARKQAIREASLCPSARLTAWDRTTKRPYEFRYEPSLGLIEDPVVGASGGVWVRGGIPIRREDGRTYELRNRVVLCRCGQSANKPYCDGTHAAVKWQDGLEAAAAERTEEPAPDPVPAE